MKGLILFEVAGLGVLLILAAPSRATERLQSLLRGLGAAVIILALVLAKCWIEVGPATVAAVYNPLRGGIQRADLSEGWHLIAPWTTARYFSVRTRAYTMGSQIQERGAHVEDAILSQTSEGLSLNIDATVLFHISSGDANRLWKAVGPNYEGVIVRPNVREAGRMVVAQYPVMSVYSNAPGTTEGTPGVDFFPGKRQEVADKIFEHLAQRLKEKGVTLERFLLRNVDYTSKEYEAAIVQKQVAQQRIVTQQYEAEIQRVRAQANIVRAEGDAEAIRLKANALRVNAKVVQWEMVKRLPDNMEVVILPDRAMPMIDLREAGPPAQRSAPQPAAPGP